MFICLHIFLIVYTIPLNFLSSGNFSATYYAASTIGEVLPCAIFISIVLLKQKFDLNKFYDIILVVGLFQVILVILAMIFPGLRDWAIASSGNEALEDIYESMNVFRMYGWARGLTFSMPLFQGLCIIIASVLGTYKSSRYYLIIPFYLLSIAVNARIALISLFIVPIISLFFIFDTKKTKLIISIVLVLITLFSAVILIQYQAENSLSFSVWNWLNSGIDELLYFYEYGEGKGNLASLTDTMWFMPEGINLLFGTGENVFGRGYQSSDIGYVVNLYYGGIVLSISLYFSYLILLMKYNRDNMIEKVLNLSIIAYLFMANLKGNVFRPNEIIHGVLLLIVFSIMFRKFNTTKQYNGFNGDRQ